MSAWNRNPVASPTASSSARADLQAFSGTDTQYGTIDRVATWLVDRLLMGPLFWLDRAIDNALADLGTED